MQPLPVWRSQEEAGSAGPEQREPPQTALLAPASSRRDFLRRMGASLALAGLSGCTIRQPREQILPYVNPPDVLTLGEPLFFATAAPRDGFGFPVLVRSDLGRPTKIEGNPDLATSRGSADARTQASLLGLYDPDRSQTLLSGGLPATWDGFLGALATAANETNLCLLTGTVTSPTLADQIRRLLARYPGARWFVHEPWGRSAERAALQQLYKRDLTAQYRFDQAVRVLALDADFLQAMPDSVRYARDWMRGRKIRRGARAMNRLYVAEPTPTITGASADHRLALRAGQIEALARRVAVHLAVPGVPAGESAAGELLAAKLLDETAERWIAVVADDLAAHRGRSLIIAGPGQPPSVHALAHALNFALGNIGKTVVYTAAIEENPDDATANLSLLCAAIRAATVRTLVVLDNCNPVYTAPADLNFAELLPSVPLTIHHGLYVDETAALCRWHVPGNHFLEAWSDCRAPDGTALIQQPLIAPLYNGKSTHEILAALLRESNTGGYDTVRDYWRRHRAERDFENFWRRSVHDGFVAGSAAALRNNLPAPHLPILASLPPASVALELIFRPDERVGDGRDANNAWLQELPHPITKLVWENAALIAPETARKNGWETGRIARLHWKNRALEIPIFVLPGQAENTITLPLGFGRTRAGVIGNHRGANAYTLRTSDGPLFGDGVEVTMTDAKADLATTQTHHTMEGRDLIQTATFANWQKALPEKSDQQRPSLLPEYAYPGYAWGMTIDLSACIGCGACTLACQAENNIPVVGKDEVRRGREMHWIRVDRYFSGGPEQPNQIVFQPVPCMHCEKAPCELVCPVEATVHDEDGINNMVYNRCVGTRYCSNNCPYKVRRFNFLAYAHGATPDTVNYDLPVIQLLANPEVTVRSRGVMEKCTYCIQRVKRVEIQAEKEERRVRDGEVVTACQQTCPTNAIIFGDLNDKNSRVSQEKAQPQNYGLLAELNTQPRTTYLARITNPNPALEQTT